MLLQSIDTNSELKDWLIMRLISKGPSNISFLCYTTKNETFISENLSDNNYPLWTLESI